MKNDVPRKAEGYIEEIAAALERDGAIAREGNAASTILQVAADEEASLIAMSTHGRAGIARWAFGSVAENVLRASRMPMLITRSVVVAEPA